LIVKGSSADPVCLNLRRFLKNIGHGVDDEKTFIDPWSKDKTPMKVKDYEESELGGLKLLPNHITIIVMNSIDERDKWLAGTDVEMGEMMQNSIVVYSGKDNPFSDGTANASRLMKFLVLSRNDCQNNLAKDIFSSIAVRVVKYLHHGHEELVL